MSTKGSHKEILGDLQEKYDKVRKLLDEDSKRDSANEPYHSKYVASGILTDMKSTLVKLLDDMESETSCFLKYKSMLGVISLNLGLISIDTEELATGEEHLTNTVNNLYDYAMKPEVILILMTALNQLGLLWSDRGDHEKSKEYLEKAEKLYEEFVTTSAFISVVSFHDLFRTSSPEISQPDSENMLGKLYTLTLYYLAQIYGSLNDHVKSAAYCHTTLRRQLESKDFDPVDWAINSATLSQYFMEKNAFSQSRHHLSAASFVLEQYETDLNLEEGNDESSEAKRERFQHRSADVARCWAKYGLMLLSSSKKRLVSQGDEENEMERLGSSDTHVEGISDAGNLWFPSLELSRYEEQITNNYILVYDDARKVFLNAQNWLTEAKKYYSLDGHASDYVQIIQDLSQLYRYLAFFEEDEERQCRMHKRRIDHLESVLKELNPQYYLLVCRQMWYELGETYSDILDIKLQKLQTNDERPTPHALRKVNHLVEQSILNFNKFLDSLRDTSTSKMPTRFTEDVLRPVLIANFRIGRLYSKIVTPDKAMQLEYLKQSLDSYKFIVDYCESDKDARNQVSVELVVCEEMVKLLPLKLERMQQEILQC